jgi:hypothetical protein
MNEETIIKEMVFQGQMTEAEKADCAKSSRDISLSYQQAAESRTGELADEFTRLEVQIATVLFIFIGFFFNFFVENGKHLPLSIYFGLKLMFAICVFFLVASLTLGLLHLKNKEKFWDRMSHQRILRLLKWIDAVKKKVTFEEALAYHEGTSLQKGPSISSPSWSWMLQTICLGISIIMLFILFLVVLFS